MVDRDQDALEGFTVEALKADWARFYAMTRCLEIISEATRRLSDGIEQGHPDVPWRAIRAAGNIYRHAYSRVLEERVLATVQDGLDALHAAVIAELRFRR